MNVLGISAFYHDSAACLVQQGRIVAAAQEERFTRVRFDASFPVHAIQSCLATAGLAAKDIDAVAFYEKPLLRFDRAMATFLDTVPASYRPFVRTAPAWMRERLRLPKVLREELGWRGTVVYVAHHEAHAASAFLASPFDDAAILTVDGVGEWTTNAIGRGRGSDVTLLEDIRFPHSLGLFYAAITEYLGFEVLADESKVMGLAAYGTPRFAGAILERLVHVRDDGSYRLDLPHFRFVEGAQTIDPARFEALFGAPPRLAEGPLDALHVDVAASAQAVLESVLLKQAHHARALVDAPHLVMAGGVALNAVANGRIAREGPFERVWVQPAAGDAGGAVGAALLVAHRLLGVKRPERTSLTDDSMSGALLGPAFDDAEARAAVGAAGLDAQELTDNAVDTAVAARLEQGQVVGWFQGRMEFGPRALGSRSILADPRSPDAQQRVNARIKFREGFRPFAPAVLETHAKAFFEIDPPSPYMLFVAPVTPTTIPAVTHVDGTARIQTVGVERHPRFHRLLSAFERRSGCAVVLNTSFNLRGEPIVCTPADALNTFLASEMDALVLGRLVVERPAGRSRPLPAPPVRPPSRAQIRAFGRDLALGMAGAAVLLVVLAVRRHAPGLAPFAAACAGASVALAWVRARYPEALRRPVAIWKPVANAVSRGLSFVTLSIVYVLVVMPIACLRRGRPSLEALPDDRSLPSFWRPAEAPRGGPDRMY